MMTANILTFDHCFFNYFYLNAQLDHYGEEIFYPCFKIAIIYFIMH